MKEKTHWSINDINNQLEKEQRISEQISKLSPLHIDIMRHTRDRAAGGFYCGDSPEMQELVAWGLMESAGRKSFVPEEYFRLTHNGRVALRMITGI